MLQSYVESYNLFLVDVSNSRLAEIEHINTWLTCHSGCPNAIGSNTIRRVAEEPLKFQVEIHRDRPLPDWTIEAIIGDEFKIHYEVEGPCAENDV